MIKIKSRRFKEINGKPFHMKHFDSFNEAHSALAELLYAFDQFDIEYSLIMERYDDKD